MVEFYRIMYRNPKGIVVERFFQKAPRGFHPAEIISDEKTTIQIEQSKIISMQRIYQ